MSNLKDESVDKNIGIISMHDFLHFLKISSRVNESLEKNTKLDGQFSYDQLSKNEFINNLMKKYKNHSDTSVITKNDNQKEDDNKKRKRLSKPLSKNISLKSKVNESIDSTLFPNLNPCLSEKLDEVLNQGILDSFLPLICNQQQAQSKVAVAPSSQLAVIPSANPSTSSNLNKPKHLIQNQKSFTTMDPKLMSSSENGIIFSQRSFRKKSPIVVDQIKISEPELTIHVCDEVKNVSRDFTCPQKLLVSKMGYFADITSGQKLEDMDISVHCDLEIFDWLIKWVKKEMMASPDNWPKLSASNVVPILVSASFLQMEPLLLDCLSYCHAHLSDIVKVSPNLGCLNDNIISRLAAMFTNLELEMVKDKKDRIQPRLFCKMIQSLCEVEAQSIRGHFATLAGLFRCLKCGKYMTQSVASYVHCIPQNMKLNRWGQIIASHQRDQNWSLSNYISNLYKDLKSWRRVYWRLWANCHFLYCSICDTHFPTSQMQWCMFHPDLPQFLGSPSEGGKIGRFPCCGLQLAYRYENITVPSSGCQFRDHCVVAENDRDRAILILVTQVSENNNSMMFEPPPVSKLSTSNSSQEPWWNGMSILSNRTRQGILPALHFEGDFRYNNRKYRPHSVADSSSDETESSDCLLQGSRSNLSSTSSSDGEESECSPSRRVASGGKRRVKTGFRSWSKNLSARSNQDNQREFEEKAMKQIISLVSKKTGISDQTQNNLNYNQGGTYFALENEWKETIKQRNLNVKASKAK
ncbi:CLUMA_CG009640, isoform A [Clunio marinus]|uniref:CLUMA_CG009640, isoform A n=1 Tax=Clunio marinus TaxID=568069 RepID=A0A1J1I9G3_9DIPT|nr:CLUMA_CG009640, isoform A [Clunio marinus]